MTISPASFLFRPIDQRPERLGLGVRLFFCGLDLTVVECTSVGICIGLLRRRIDGDVEEPAAAAEAATALTALLTTESALTALLTA